MKKNPDMWFLLLFYSIAILFGLLALKSLGRFDQAIVSSVFIMGIFTFCALFFYMKNTIDLLRPDNVIKMLTEEINVENIHQKEWKDEFLQPVFDVVNASIMRYDATTTRIGLYLVSTKILNFYPNINETERINISNNFCDHLHRSAQIAFRNNDEGTIREIILILKKFSFDCVEFKNSEIIEISIKSLRYIGVQSAKNDFELATWQIADSLKEIGVRTTKNDLEVATWQATHVLEEIGSISADNDLNLATCQVVNSLKIIGIQSADKSLKGATQKIFQVLDTLGKHTIEKWGEDELVYFDTPLGSYGIPYSKDKKMINMGKEHWQTPTAIVMTGIHSEDNLFDDPVDQIISTTLEVVEHTIDNNLMDLIVYPVRTLESISTLSLDKGSNKPSLWVLSALEKLCIHLIQKNGSIENILQVTEALTRIGMRAIDHNLEEIVIHVVFSLKRIGENAAKYDQNTPNSKVFLALKREKIISKKRELRSKASMATNALEEIGFRLAECGFDRILIPVVESLYNIGCIESGRDPAVKSLAYLLSVQNASISSAIKEVESQFGNEYFFKVSPIDASSLDKDRRPGTKIYSGEKILKSKNRELNNFKSFVDLVNANIKLSESDED
jgi:hypothetical protein